MSIAIALRRMVGMRFVLPIGIAHALLPVLLYVGGRQRGVCIIIIAGSLWHPHLLSIFIFGRMVLLLVDITWGLLERLGWALIVDGPAAVNISLAGGNRIDGAALQVACTAVTAVVGGRYVGLLVRPLWLRGGGRVWLP
jgi:hypothetical protein